MKRMNCNLKEAREAAGLSQERLAQTLCVSRETIRNIESGKSLPNVLLAIRISNAVKREITYLFQPK